MSIGQLNIGAVSVYSDSGDAAFTEVEQYRHGCFQAKLNFFMPGNNRRMRSQGKLQMIANIGYLAGPLARQIAGDAFRGSGKEVRYSEQQKQSEFEHGGMDYVKPARGEARLWLLAVGPWLNQNLTADDADETDGR